MKLSLVVLASGSMQGKALDIKLSQFLVGRDPQCHLRPASPLISKRHCAIIQRDGKVFIRDFGSTNGTFVNDEPVKGEAELHHDDRLKIGPLLFSVKVEAGAPVNQPTPLPPTKAASTTKTAPVTPGTDANLPAARKGAATPAGKKPVQAAAPAPTKEPEKAAEGEAAETVSDAAKEAARKPAPAEAATGAPNGDDDIAAMLLSLQDDDGPSTAGLTSDPVPDGSTVMDLVVPPPGTDPNATKLDKDKDKDKNKNANMGNTSSAAKSILEKYMRRPRNQ